MHDNSYLDPEQRLAVTAPDGNVSVVAGAGTGKTFTIVERVKHLILEFKVPPEEIVVVTFTNKAAAEIKQRVMDAVGPQAINIRMGTFHSLSLRILRRYAEMTGLQSSRFLIADDEDTRKLLDLALDAADVFPAFEEPARPEGVSVALHKETIKSEKKEWEANRKEYMKVVLQQIPRWKECGLHISEALAKDMPSLMEAELIRVYEAYQLLLDDRNLCDFADLLLRVVNLLDHHPDIVERESKTIRHLLVDECQDSNMLQRRWMDRLSHYWGNLFIVGDGDQSLYSFRGSAPEIMTRLAEKSVRHITLKTNRRCTTEILEPANRLVDINARSAPKVLISGRNGSPVALRRSQNEFGEAKMIAAEVKKLVARGCQPDQIAIIARASFILKPVEKELLRSGVPYALMGGVSILEREEIKDVLAYLKLAIDPFNDLAFQRIANKPVRGAGPTTVQFLIETARSQRVSFSDVCHMVASEAIKGPARKNVLGEIAKLGSLLSNLALSYEMGVPSASIVDLAYEESGYKVAMGKKKDDFNARDENVEFLRSFAGQFDDLCDFLQEFSITSDAVAEGNGVRLGTIHASKGLEYDHVFLPGWEEGIFPSPRSIDEIPGDIDDSWVGPPIGGIEEERRIAHVALTRARHSVTVLHAEVRAKRRAKPSRFIAEAGIGGSDRSSRDRDVEHEFQSEYPDEDFSPITFNKPVAPVRRQGLGTAVPTARPRRRPTPS
jgi:DNA helicase II / ATP-dependent DNA helicase PcrA